MDHGHRAGTGAHSVSSPQVLKELCDGMHGRRLHEVAVGPRIRAVAAEIMGSPLNGLLLCKQIPHDRAVVHARSPEMRRHQNVDRALRGGSGVEDRTARRVYPMLSLHSRKLRGAVVVEDRASHLVRNEWRRSPSTDPEMGKQSRERVNAHSPRKGRRNTGRRRSPNGTYRRPKTTDHV